MPELLILSLACIIGLLVIKFIFAGILGGLHGGAGIVSEISSCGGGCMLLGIVVIVIVSGIGGFIAGKLGS